MNRLTVDIADLLARFSAEREDIWVLDGDLGDSYGLYTRTQQPRYSRFVQVGIAEQALVAIAAGLAAVRKFPWVFSFSAFLCHRAADQIRTCIAHQKLPVILVGSHAGAATGPNGCSHAALSDLGLIASIGGIELWAPADAADVQMAVGSLISRPRAAYIRASREPVKPLSLPPGRIRTNGLLGDVVLVSTGYASQWADEVVASLALQGIPMPWSHFAQLRDDVLHDWVRHYPLMRVAVVLEDHGAVGGLADAVRRVAPPGVAVKSLAWPSRWHGEAGSICDLRHAFGLDTESIVRSVRETLG